MTTDNLFEKASRKKLRFDSTKGKMSVEHLWELPLTDLDQMFKHYNKLMKESEEESLLSSRTEKDRLNDLRVEVIQHVVKTRLDEQKTRDQKEKNKEQKEMILQALEHKEKEELLSKTPEELRRLVETL